MSKWITITHSEIRRNFKNGGTRPTGLPAGGGCYALYADGQLYYIGSTQRLQTRLAEHVTNFDMHAKASHVGSNEAGPILVRDWRIKVRPARFYGEWGTLELRLLRRLKPPRNKLTTR